MVAIRFRFPGGRFHATPWEHHVNEGVPEWPPAPWRILRALLAVWWRKARNEVEEPVVRRLLNRLSERLPTYVLPSGVAAHTRHYMPPFKGKKTKVLDTFVHMKEPGEIIVDWAGVALDGEMEEALRTLLSRFSYLGRAESWVEASMVREPVGPAVIRPFLEDDPYPQGEETEVRPVLAPLASDEYDAWRREALARREEEFLAAKRRKAEEKGTPPDRVKLTTREREALSRAIPADLFAALHAETGGLRKAGWNRPPGSRYVDYSMPGGILGTVPAPRAAPASGPPPCVARFALSSAVLPRLTEAISVAERFRQALVKGSDGAPVFTGKNAGGEPLADHRHAYYLPETKGRHGRITHMTLYAPMGFDACARRALEDVTRVWGHGGHALQLVLLGMGAPREFAMTGSEGAPFFRTAVEWRSVTPFVATRHPKTTRSGQPRRDERGRWIGSPEHDLVRLLEAAGFPEPEVVEPLAHTRLGGKRTSWLEFRTLRRKGHGRRALHPGTGFRILFPEPVTGPIAVGYGAHFGLGLFTPVPTPRN